MKRTPILRKSRPKKTNPARRRIRRSTTPIKKRKRSKAERERIYGPPGFVEWIHEQPCVGCGVVGFSQVAHIQTGGTGRKDDWVRTVPLCGPRPRFLQHGKFLPGCHNLFHGWGRRNFEFNKRIDLVEEAEENQIAWLSFLGSSPGGQT